MAELLSKDRLQPALLERLTDYEPQQRSEPRERRVVSMRQLRENVLRDIGALLNATRRFASDDLTDCPLVECSVLNYGLPVLTGKAWSSVKALDILTAISQTIRRFEPRIVSSSLRVSALPAQAGAHHNAIAFLIEGDMWAQPYPERLYFKTELDLECGEVFVSAQDEARMQ